MRPMKILFFANTEWHLFNFRLALAKHLRDHGVEVVMVSPPGPYGKQIEAEGFRWIPIPMVRRSLNPLREVRLLWELSGIYKKEKPDLAHHFTVKCVVYGGLAASISRTRAVVSAVTGMGYVFSGDSFLKRILRSWVCSLLRWGINGTHRRLILQNPDDRQVLLTAGVINKESARVIVGSGVNTQRFHPNPLRAVIPGKPRKIVFAARLLWDKGVKEFIDAAQIIRTAGYEAEFIIAGEPDPGNPGSIPVATLKKWKKEGAVNFAGHVADMAVFLREADIVVLASRYGEGVPRSLTEAAATGLPIVTTNTPGCREIVKDGVNGYLIHACDPHALAEVLIKMIKDPALAVRMGEAGRARVLAEFDERLVFEQTLNVYRELLPGF